MAAEVTAALDGDAGRRARPRPRPRGRRRPGRPRAPEPIPAGPSPTSRATTTGRPSGSACGSPTASRPAPRPRPPPPGSSLNTWLVRAVAVRAAPAALRPRPPAAAPAATPDSPAADRSTSSEESRHVRPHPRRRRRRARPHGSRSAIPPARSPSTAVEGAEQLEVRRRAARRRRRGTARPRGDRRPGTPSPPTSPTRLRVAVPERRLLRTPAFAVRITTPPGAAARVAVASADAELTRPVRRPRAHRASGDLDVEHGSDVQVRTASGDTRIGTVDGRGSVASASGDVRIGHGLRRRCRCAPPPATPRWSRPPTTCTISTASGDVTVGAAGWRRRADQDGLRGRLGRRGPGPADLAGPPSVSGRMDSQLDDDGDAGDRRGRRCPSPCARCPATCGSTGRRPRPSR